MKQITFKQYRTIDLVFLSLIAAIFESVATLATNNWFVKQPMAVSITLTITCIAAFRWSYYAFIPALVGSLMHCITSSATIEQFIYYCGGSLLFLVSIPLLKRIGKEKVRNDFIIRSFYAIVAYISFALGRWLLSLLFEVSLNNLVVFLSTDILSLLFAIVVLTLAKGGDGLLEDQKSYLLRLDKERREEEEADLSDPFNNSY